MSGVSFEMPEIRNWVVDQGRFFEESEQRGYARVCVIGETVRQNLFDDDEDPVGKTVRIGAMPFRVIGVLAAKGANGWGQDHLYPKMYGMWRGELAKALEKGDRTASLTGKGVRDLIGKFWERRLRELPCPSLAPTRTGDASCTTSPRPPKNGSPPPDVDWGLIDHHDFSRYLRMAMATASERLAAPIFCRRALTCSFTIGTPIPS